MYERVRGKADKDICDASSWNVVSRHRVRIMMGLTLYLECKKMESFTHITCSALHIRKPTNTCSERREHILIYRNLLDGAKCDMAYSQFRILSIQTICDVLKPKCLAIIDVREDLYILPENFWFRLAPAGGLKGGMQQDELVCNVPHSVPSMSRSMGRKIIPESMHEKMSSACQFQMVCAVTNAEALMSAASQGTLVRMRLDPMIVSLLLTQHAFRVRCG